jgi:membrane fusion protein (multidrug efflux system)
MNNRILMLLLALALPLALSGCNGANATDAESDEDKEEEVAIPVEIATVESATVYAAYNGTTTLEAEQQADIVAKTSGIILEILVEEGDMVRADQVVARLDGERLKLETDRAAANLRKLENDFRRNEELFKKELISSEAFEKARFNLESERATYELAKLEYSYTEVRSPIDGVISERMVRVGNLINLHAALFRVDDFDPLLAVLHVPERELTTLSKGQEALLSADAIAGQSFVGYLARISPVVDARTGTFKVTVEVHEPDARLKPGMFGRVQIVHDVHADVITVPQDALVVEDRNAYVYVVEDNRAQRVDVEIGYTTDARIEVLNGLENGQIVVTSGKGSLSEDALVDMINGENTETELADSEADTESGES